MNAVTISGLSKNSGISLDELNNKICNIIPTVQEINDKYGEPDALAIVGLHGLFAAGINDQHFRLMKGALSSVRDRTSSMLFTDAGSLVAFSPGQRRATLKVYYLFDILAFNGDPFEGKGSNERLSRGSLKLGLLISINTS
jgi:hypothetical protein